MSKRESGNFDNNGQSEKKKKRKSRWTNDEADKTFIPGMPTTLPADATEDQREQYLLQLQIEESTRRLRSGDLGISANPEERSPSPEPIYNNEGKRMNTREYRTRKALEEGRHEKIQKLLEINSNYKPPSDYKPPIIRVNDKVYIPQDDHPEINFVGLLIGPRGNTLKTLEKETGAKIIIRGKGSVKEGKIGRKDGQPLPGEDEPLHAYITANDPANVKKAVTRIHEIIKEGIEVPEEKNDLRKQQLRELALLNGTLRDNDSGLQKLRQIAEAETIITNQIICTKCGAAGHIARDCVQKTPAELAHNQMVASGGKVDALPANTIVGRQDRAKMDSEYMSLMAELGQVAPDSLKSEFAKMAQPLPPGQGQANGSPATSGFNRMHGPDTSQAQNSAQNSSPALTLSADYGYGGRRSRFDEFENSRNRGQFDGSNGHPPNRFPHGPGPGMHPPFPHGQHSRFDQGPAQQYNQGAPQQGFNQGFNQGHPQSRFDQGPQMQSHPRFDQGHPSRFDQRPGPSDAWRPDVGQADGHNNMMNSNRWGASTAPPPPPGQSAPPPPYPPPMPPLPSGPGNWTQNSSNNSPWQQQSNAPAPPWQNSNYGNNPAPPPPPSSGYGGGYSGGNMPPPPPPQ